MNQEELVIVPNLCVINEDKISKGICSEAGYSASAWFWCFLVAFITSLGSFWVETVDIIG